MGHPFAITALAIATLTLQPPAGAEAPRPVRAEDLRWVRPPVPGLQVAWVLGAEDRHGLYLVRVKLEAGARIPPHTHPDERNTTVLSGTLYVGFGARFDETSLVPVAQGSVYVAPAGVPHFLLARDGDTVYQESGFGPSATTLVGR